MNGHDTTGPGSPMGANRGVTHSSLAEKIVISPRRWPGKRLNVQPGDLDAILPHGFGLAKPPVYEWDDPFDSSSGNAYGFQERTGHPIANAPLTSPSGGIVYFGSKAPAGALANLCKLLTIDCERRDFAAFMAETTDPIGDRWLVQLRIVSRFALRFVFEALGRREYERFPAQRLTLLETLEEFLRDQQYHWIEASSDALRGAAGGDNDSSWDELGFGFMVENDYHGVYRIWSRAWLVTK